MVGEAVGCEREDVVFEAAHGLDAVFSGHGIGFGAGEQRLGHFDGLGYEYYVVEPREHGYVVVVCGTEHGVAPGAHDAGVSSPVSFRGTRVFFFVAFEFAVDEE